MEGENSGEDGSPIKFGRHKVEEKSGGFLGAIIESIKDAFGFGKRMDDYSTAEKAEESQAFNDEQMARMKATVEGLHTINETALTIVPFGQVGYKFYTDRSDDITGTDFALEAVAIIPIAKIGKVGIVIKSLNGGRAVLGFKTFNAFKKAYGVAGKGKTWHHIVEQTSSNVSKFGAENIHNIDNVIKIEHGAGTLHAKVSGYYSSKDFFTGGQTVRQWLSTQSYQAQYDFGIQTLKKFGWTP